MNFLAHSYLSFDHAEIVVGNMISDFVKGRKKFDFTQGIQKGIQLHRDIDTFTDSHAATAEAKLFLKPAVGLYAGAFVDVVFDHFLANDPLQFTDASLQVHAANIYVTLRNMINVLPETFRFMLPYMTSQNWLYGYKNTAGIKSSFAGVARRAAYLESSDEVFGLFEQHYASLRKCYNNFFPHLKTYALYRLQQLLND